MVSQLTNTVVMVRPDTFGFNPQTAATNEFQHKPSVSEKQLRAIALAEFTHMVDVLRLHKINVLVIPSPQNAIVPDAVFPNNWFSFHEDHTLVVYPMLAPNRRLERQTDALKQAVQDVAPVRHVIDLTDCELQKTFLEGTGSLVLDRVRKTAFAVLSPRTDESLVRKWGKRMGYKTIVFHAEGLKGHMPIYHTNVLMNIGNGFCVIALDAIGKLSERKKVVHAIDALGPTCIDISLEQLHAFCGNMLAVNSEEGKVKIILSETAFVALDSKQKKQLSAFGELVPVSIPTIERVGGGSARCMMAEVFS